MYSLSRVTYTIEIPVALGAYSFDFLKSSASKCLGAELNGFTLTSALGSFFLCSLNGAFVVPVFEWFPPVEP